jgi:hypothetical protein
MTYEELKKQAEDTAAVWKLNDERIKLEQTTKLALWLETVRRLSLP